MLLVQSCCCAASGQCGPAALSVTLTGIGLEACLQAAGSRQHMSSGIGGKGCCSRLVVRRHPVGAACICCGTRDGKRRTTSGRLHQPLGSECLVKMMLGSQASLLPVALRPGLQGPMHASRAGACFATGWHAMVQPPSSCIIHLDGRDWKWTLGIMVRMACLPWCRCHCHLW